MCVVFESFFLSLLLICIGSGLLRDQSVVAFKKIYISGFTNLSLKPARNVFGQTFLPDEGGICRCRVVVEMLFSKS